MKTLLLIISLALLVSCNSKDAVINPHQSKLEDETFKNINSGQLRLNGMDYASSRKHLTAFKGRSQDLYRKIIKPLELRLINREKLTNPFTQKDDFSSWLNLYTEALLDAVKNNPSQEVKDAFDRFIDLAYLHCNESLRNCSLVNTFRLSPNSNKLLLHKAKLVGTQANLCLKSKQECNALIAEKYKHLALANSLKVSRLADTEFVISYLEHSHLLAKINSSGLIKDYNNDLFNTVINFFEVDQGNLDIGCDIVKQYNTWAYSRLHLNSGSLSMKKLFELSTNCDLYTENKELTDSFKNSISEIQTIQDNGSSLSFFNKAQMAQNNSSDRIIFKHFGLENELKKASSITTKNGKKSIDHNFYNEYFFVIDRLYNGHIGLDEAQQILSVANRNHKELIKSIENYNKLQLVFTVIKTKSYLKDKLFNSEVKSTSEDLFNRAIQDSEPMAQEWNTLQTKMNLLKSAIKSTVDSSGNKELVAQFKKFEHEVRYLSSTIKFIATYPAMMALAHLLAEEEGTVSTITYWGKIEESATTVYERLWKGVSNPWFAFSDQQPINKFYLLYSFDYALKADFVTLQRSDTTTNTDSQDLTVKYMSILMNKYLGRERALLDKAFHTEYLPTTQGNTQAESNKHMCNTELNPNSDRTSLVTMTLEELESRLHSGIGKSATNSAIPTINFFDTSSKLLKQIHEKIDPKLKIAKLLVHIAEKNGIDNKALTAAKDELTKTENLVRKIITNFVTQFKYQSACFKRLHLVEKYYNYLVFEQERSYLSQVWDDMAALQNLDNSSVNQGINEINNHPERYRDAQHVNVIDINHINFDRFTGKNTFIYSQFDFLVRVKNSLEKGTLEKYTTTLLNQVTNSWKNKFQDATLKPINNQRHWDILTPPNLRDNRLITNRSKDLNLTWMSKKEEFVSHGLRALSGGGNSFVQWQTENNNLSTLKSALEAATYLYLSEHKEAMAANHKISIEDLLRSMRDIIYFTEINPIDTEMINVFGQESKIVLNDLKGILVDESLRESLHPYTYLYNGFKDKTGLSSSIFKLRSNQLSEVISPFADAYLLSLNLNDPLFVISFRTHEWMIPVLKDTFQKTATHYISKVDEFAKAMKRYENIQDSAILYRIENNKPVSLSDTSLIPLGSQLIHPKKLEDIVLFINYFDQYTKDIYNTTRLTGDKDK